MLLFPPIEALCSKLLNRMPKNHVLGIAGSYSWASGAFPALRTFAEKARLERAEPDVEVFTSPTAEDLARCEAMGRDLGTKVIAQTEDR